LSSIARDTLSTMDRERDPLERAAWYAETGYPQEALDALRGADPTDPQVAWVLGRALIDTGKAAAAADVARRALAGAPENVLLLELLANAQMTEEPDAAERTLRAALAVEPENPRLFGLYVVILLQQQRFEWAERMLERLMRLAPDDESTQRIRAVFMQQAAGWPGARDAVRDFLRAYPDDAFAHYLQGLTELSGRWWKGRWHLREAARLRPQDPVLVETARLMNAWYMLPVHALGGPVRWAVSIAAFAACMFYLVQDDDRSLWVVAAMLGYAALRWTLFFVTRAALARRIRRALRTMYG
jgi:predicted Zn-dependent protease